jgi:Fe-S-cluster containining protein
MQHAIAALARDVRVQVHAGIASLAGIEGRVTCPLLSENGSCRIYDARPIACRSYGFYTERDAGLHCERVLDALAPELDQVVWGNGEALARELDALGEARPLDRWLKDAGE